MADPFTIGVGLGIFNTIIGGLTGAMQDVSRSKQQRAQARQLQTNIKQLRKLVQDGEKTIDEAFTIFDNMLKAQKGEISRLTENYRDRAIALQQEAFDRTLSSMDRQIEKAKEQMSLEEQKRAERTQEQIREYRLSIKEQQKQVIGELQKRRLIGSKAGIKTREELMGAQTKGEKQIAQTREDTAQELFERMLGLEKEAIETKERVGREHETRLGRTQEEFADLLSEKILGIEKERAGGKVRQAEQKLGLRMGAEQQIMQMQNMIAGLQSASEGLPVSFLQGITPGLSQIGGAYAQKQYGDYYIDQMGKLLSQFQYPQPTTETYDFGKEMAKERLLGYESPYGGR